MSYDFMLIKTTVPVSTMSDIEEDKVAEFDAWDSVKANIENVLPDIAWSESDGALWGTTKSIEGRFEILVSDYSGEVEEGTKYGIFHVLGSHRIGQEKAVIQIGEETDFNVFDMQTMKILYKQTKFA